MRAFLSKVSFLLRCDTQFWRLKAHKTCWSFLSFSSPLFLLLLSPISTEGTGTLCSRMGCTSPLHAQDCTCPACPVERADELNFHQEKEAHCAARGSWVFVGGVDKNIQIFPIIRQKIHVAACTQASSLSDFVIKLPFERLCSWK